MTESVTITFSQTGVQPPVYVVTSMSEPPWEPLEMTVDEEQTASANLIFTRQFNKVAEGDHQYKIRVGDGHWVVDDSKDAAADEHGNRNNVIHVKPAQDQQSHLDKAVAPTDSRKDSTMDSSDADRPASVAVPQVPRVVVEKTDNRLDYGDDFGDNATTAQKVAHDMRAADAAPNKLVINSEGHIEPGTEEDRAAPLFRHESFQADDASASPVLDAIDEVSTDYTSSGDAINTPSDPGQSQDNQESNNEPLLSHEIGSDDADFDELNNGPLLPHETGWSGDIASSDGDEDELDAAPLLPHETGFSNYTGSRAATNSDYTRDDISEPRHYMYEDDDLKEYQARSLEPDQVPMFTHEDLPNSDDEHYEEDDPPLLPHERDFADVNKSSREDHGGFPLHSQATFGCETDMAKNMFGGTGRPSIFRKRTHSSSLPHRMARTDAEDENLLDPSLERFPTSREHILDRVATIGLHLPEDQTMEDHIHSPVMSVLSQACSSVDLVPVKSYTSLASVPESDEDDDEADEDINSLPSPMISHFGTVSADFARDPHATPLPNDSKRLGCSDNQESQELVDRTTRSSEADSVAKTDGTKETILSTLRDTTTTSNKVLTPITPPLTPENKSTPSIEDATKVSEPQLRQRQVPEENTLKDSSASMSESNTRGEHTTHGAVKTSKSQQLSNHNETFLQTFFRSFIGSVGRFLTACVGDRKRAGITIFAVSVTAAAFYIVTSK